MFLYISLFCFFGRMAILEVTLRFVSLAGARCYYSQPFINHIQMFDICVFTTDHYVPCAPQVMANFFKKVDLEECFECFYIRILEILVCFFGAMTILEATLSFFPWLVAGAIIHLLLLIASIPADGE